MSSTKQWKRKNVWRVAWWIMNMISGIQYKSERHHVLRKKGKKKTTKEQKEYTSLKSVMCSGCGIKYHKRPLSGVHYLISCFPLKKFLSPKFRPQQALSYQNGLWTNHQSHLMFRQILLTNKLEPKNPTAPHSIPKPRHNMRV